MVIFLKFYLMVSTLVQVKRFTLRRILIDPHKASLFEIVI